MPEEAAYAGAIPTETGNSRRKNMMHHLSIHLFAVASLCVSGLCAGQTAEITPLLPASQSQPTAQKSDTASLPQKQAVNGLIDPMQATVSPDVDLKSLLEMVLSTKDDGERYLQLSAFIKKNGPWIPLQGSQGFARIHITSYLLQSEREADAVSLLKNRDVPGWLSYSFMGGVANDFMFAVDAGYVNYVATLCLVYPDGVNQSFVVTADGHSMLPLGYLASPRYKSKPYYESLIRTLLKHGANPVLAMDNGLTPMTIASSESNATFLRIIQSFQAENEGRDAGLLENTPLTSLQIAEQQRITDSLLEKTIEERKANYGYARLHEMWLQMIMNGFNIPANLLYDTLVTFPEFSIDKKNDIGMNAIMAASMSNLYGGNVDYARVLIERGANPAQIIEMQSENGVDKPIKTNLIQAALPNDNFKIVALLITKGVDFVVSPDVEVKDAESEDVLILTEAVGLQAYRSAYIIWQALSQHLEKIEKQAQAKKS